MEIKGILKRKGERYATCCASVDDIQLDGHSVYDYMSRVCGDSDNYTFRYVILDIPPEDPDIDFNDLAAEVCLLSIYSSYKEVCYSEWTCGQGGYLLENSKGHSMFNELWNKEGKYVHIISTW